MYVEVKFEPDDSQTSTAWSDPNLTDNAIAGADNVPGDADEDDPYKIPR